MKIHYRILSVYEPEHSFVVRYWTDNLSELSLSTEVSRDGTPLLTDGGWPVKCRTDVNLTLYNNMMPTADAINEIIKIHAPIDWFILMENLQDANVATSLESAVSMIGTKNTIEVV